MKTHICIPVEKGIELLKNGDNFTTGTPQQALRVLTEYQVAGKKYFTGCDNEDENGQCKGHDDV